MKHFKKILTVTSDTPVKFFNLSFDVEECVRGSGVTNGICVVMSQHTTSAVFLDNDKEDLHRDWEQVLESLTVSAENYKVDYMPAGARHLKANLLGSSVTVPISDGKLDLGQRQYIMYGDFDGMREKGVVVKIIGD